MSVGTYATQEIHLAVVMAHESQAVRRACLDCDDWRKFMALVEAADPTTHGEVERLSREFVAQVESEFVVITEPVVMLPDAA